MHDRKIAVIGLGYVGLPVAIAFGQQRRTVGFDIDARRIDELRRGHDRTDECTSAELSAANLELTDDPDALSECDFYIVTVPTPIDAAKNPDLGPLESASELLGPRLRSGDIVVYESTVYPGATEEACVEWLEAASGLRCGSDFRVGYSPERINPGDREHRLESITKVVSGQDAATLDIVANVYESVVRAGVHRAPSIKVAEAAKVIENTQRDLNIALMNELALIFHRLDIDTADVLEAAGTKWNFLRFSPGLVGGHCIGVDPYYLTHRAALVGYLPQVILAGRRVNDGMGRFVAYEAMKRLLRLGVGPADCLITVLGLTFKENVPDLRNTRVTDIVREFDDIGMKIQLHDPIADPNEACALYGHPVADVDALAPARCVVLAVPHDSIVSGGWSMVRSLLEDKPGVVIDVRGVLPRDEVPDGVELWRL